MAIVRHTKKANKPTPIEREVDIHDLSHESQGVSRSRDKVLFVAGALPSEKIRVKIDNQKRNFDQGHILEILQASSERVEPHCKHYKLCGACQLQHLVSDKQIGYKQNTLDQQLKRQLKLDSIPWSNPIESSPFGYRRRARLGVRYRNKTDEIILGFREEANSHLTPISNCPVLNPKLDQLIQPLHKVIDGLDAKSRITQVELIAGDNDSAVVLRYLKKIHQNDKNSLINWGKTQQVQIWVQGDDQLDCLYSSTAKDSSMPLSYQLDNCDLTFDVKDFIQGNAQVNSAMVKQAMDWLALTEGDTCLDLFAGIGNFTLPLAKKVKHVYAVEGEKSMAKRIDENAKLNGLSNITASAMNLADEELLFKLPKVDAILLDPPRAGASILMPWLVKQKSRILYIACDPSSLVRDAKPLLDAGFRIEKISVMDMFPQTKHVESMALFIKD
ncbi:MAG: 23S rRNA (uracil1939-C5)-methyltransferase [Bermanella sp.]